jgi:hypothetical protein
MELREESERKKRKIKNSNIHENQENNKIPKIEKS